MHQTLIPTMLRPLIGASLALHLGAVVVLAWSAQSRAKVEGPSQTVLTTKLVRLGEKRPEHLLPRKEPPAVKTKKQVALPSKASPKKAASPAGAKKATVADRVRDLGKLSDALERLKRRSAPAGDPSGVAEGEVSDLSRAIIGNQFATEVYRCLKKHYAIEGVDPTLVAGRKATVLVRVGQGGQFLESRIVEGSDLERFDAAVRRAVKMCGRVSPPPKEILAQVRDDGIEVEFQP